MNLCSHDHDEICFEGSRCPLCSLIEEKDQKIGELNGQISDLQDGILRLKRERDNLESRLHGQADHEL